MSKIFDDIPKDLKSKVKKKNQPDWISPMLATLTDKRFSDKDWIYERKLDGERCLVFKKGKEVNLMSRNKKKLNKIYPELLEALENQKYDFIVDGEIVAFENDKTSFSQLQQRMQVKNIIKIKSWQIRKKLKSILKKFPCQKQIKCFTLTRILPKQILSGIIEKSGIILLLMQLTGLWLCNVSRMEYKNRDSFRKKSRITFPIG